MISIALLGNPNVGKTSLFNRLTGSFEHVGNWHGVTVDKVSKITSADNNINITDLPGLYSLTVYSKEEEVSRNEVIEGKCDLFVNVCEAGNLSRNLYLFLQLSELGAPSMIVVNMIDELDKAGKTLNTALLSERLGVPVAAVSAKKGFDGEKLIGIASTYAADKGKKKGAPLPYLNKLPLTKVKNIIRENLNKTTLDPTYACIKVLERDSFVLEKLALSDSQLDKLNKLGDFQTEIAKLRYEYIDAILSGVIEVKNHFSAKKSIGAVGKLDKILLNKYLALPIFLLIMSGIFWVTFGFIGNFFTNLLENGKDILVSRVGDGLGNLGAPEWLNALVSFGIIDGVGGVLVFLPQIVILFFFLALLEDSGYISRVAFMTDGIFNKIGLSGRAVFTMIMGLGCSATAVLTARGLEDDMMRKKTVILTPFMSCSARLPVYTAVAGAFFTSGNVLIIFGLYVLGCITVIASAAIFNSAKALKSGEASFIMEMPNYRLPTPERVMQILISNAKAFIVKVGTIVFALNVIVWILSNFSLTQGYIQMGSGASIMEQIGAFIAPVFSPLGFGNWKAVTALISGLMAKEVVISTITSLGGVSAVLENSLAAICFLVYTLLYVPCVATLGAIKKEAGVKWMLFGLIFQLTVAYAMTFAVRMILLSFANGILSGIIAAIAFVSIIIIIAVIIRTFSNNKGRCIRCKGDCNQCL